MATFFQGVQVGWWSTASNYIYGTLTGNVSRSGNTVTLSGMTLTLWTRYSASGSDPNQWFDVNGTRTYFTVYASGTDLGSHSLNNTSFNVSDSQTSASVRWGSYDGYSDSFTVTFPSGYTAPTGLSVSLVEKYPTGAKFNVSVSSYGNPSSASGRYIEAAILGQNTYGTTYRFATAYNTSSSAITVNNSSSGGTLTVQPNKEYYYGAYASNTQRDTSKVQGTFVTLAEAPTITLNSVTTDTAVFNYSINSDGGKYTKTFEYSIDDGTNWVTFDTVSDGNAKTGSFTLTNLLSGALYVLKTRVTTTAGTTNVVDISFNTIPTNTRETKLYGSVNGENKRIDMLYGSSNQNSVIVTKLYGSVNGESRVMYQGFGHLEY